MASTTTVCGPGADRPCAQPPGSARVVCAQLATLCVSLGDFPIIRFDDKGIPARTSGTITSMLAKAVQAKLDTALEDDPDAFVRVTMLLGWPGLNRVGLAPPPQSAFLLIAVS